jgi:hypothetical protein
MFLRFYGDEFPPSQKEKILLAIEKFSNETDRDFDSSLSLHFE